MKVLHPFVLTLATTALIAMGSAQARGPGNGSGMGSGGQALGQGQGQMRHAPDGREGGMVGQGGNQGQGGQIGHQARDQNANAGEVSIRGRDRLQTRTRTPSDPSMTP